MCATIAILVCGVLLCTVSCTTTPRTQADPLSKIELDLSSIGPDGLRGPADGRVAVSYEFAIPNTEECRAQVSAIDPTVQFMPGSQGRIGAPKSGCLCIGSTHHPAYRDVLRRLAELPYVERIVECYFE